MRAGTKLGLGVAIIAATLVVGGYWWHQKGADIRVQTVPSPPIPVAANPEISPSATTVVTKHYSIASTASASQTASVATAVESLHEAYSEFFGDMIDPGEAKTGLKLVLYKDRQEFLANNRSRPWAEAYYLPPVSYAYYPDGELNPYHWMLHEATHQLNGEVAHFKKTKWIDEGLAAYFGSSRIVGQDLLPGTMDFDAYPLWWLSSLSLTGNLQNDINSGKFIPLVSVISGKGGPDINRNVNLYYVAYWSLSHFLFHYRDGEYADRYKELIVAGGSLENFEKIVGPIDQVQGEWYEYLKEIAVVDEAPARVVELPSSDSSPSRQ